MGLSYKDAGVDLDSYAEAMARIPAMVQKTQTPRVMPLTGGFAGLFQLMGDGKQYRDPVLVSGTDGVGTKLKVAVAANRYDTVGIDLVAMCVNDCICIGAEPLFFLDYLALPKDDPDRVAQLVQGVTDGCVDSGMALIGGETAIMPDVYAPGEFDMAGFCVGVAEKDELLDGSKIAPGQVLLGVESSGLHSNGFSLVRKVVFEAANLSVDDEVSELGQTVGEALLTPTRIYAKLVNRLMQSDETKGTVTGIAHITGGGLAENLGRIMPKNVEAAINGSAWERPAIFQWLQGLGSIADDEMERVFNMGIGLVLVVDSSAADKVQAAVGEFQFGCHKLGEIRAGQGGAKYV